MFYYKLVTIILVLSINLNAAYLRTIRVGSFNTQATAEVEFQKLHKFVKSHHNILKLQEEWGFEVQLRKSGKYYITLLEPLRNKKALQVVLDTLRLRYPDVYVTKIKPSKAQIQLIPLEEIIEEAIEKVDVEEVSQIKVIEEPLVVKEVVKEKETQAQIVPIKEVKIQKTPVVQLIQPQIKQKSDESTLWKALFAISFVFLFIAMIALYLKRKECKNERKKEKQRKLQSDEKEVQCSLEMQNNANFLSESKVAMSSVIQNSNLLLEFDLSVIQKDYVKRIKSSSEGLLNVINNTSDISKMQIGELHISKSDFNIRNMINDVYNVISLDARQNNVQLHRDIAEDIPSHVIGDSAHLKQVLISLMTNSVKYTRDGDVTLTLKKVYSYSHAITLGFVVSDTGIGMSPEQVDNIVYASKNNTSTNLCVAKQLIQRMTGDMKIYSTLDVGTTFTFNIKFDLKQ